MEMLESNYKNWCALQGIVLDDGPSETDKEEQVADNLETEDFMEVDEGEEVPDFMKKELSECKKGWAKRKKRGKVADIVWEKTRKILVDKTKLAEKRARMCDEGDFLRLLYAFNNEGIHFA